MAIYKYALVHLNPSLGSEFSEKQTNTCRLSLLDLKKKIANQATVCTQIIICDSLVAKNTVSTVKMFIQVCVNWNS